MTGKRTVLENKGNSLIPCDGYVISVSGNMYPWLSSSRKIKLEIEIKSLKKEKQVFFSKAEDIVGGVPQLIKDGQIQVTWELEKSSKEFAETRHPRTAVAKLTS